MRAVAGCLAVGLLFSCVWMVVHPSLPQHPTGDVFTALATARHLCRGDGLLNDAVYPLFTSYPWGLEIPQPLLHRGPGLALLLTPAWLLSGGDPVRTEDLVRPVMLSLLCLLVMLGGWGLWKRGSLASVGAWIVLLLLNPLLALGVNWGWTEIPAGLLLLALWIILRRRCGPASLSPRAAIGVATLAALLGLVRQDLLWVPVLWWIAGARAACIAAAAHDRRRPGPSSASLLRRTALAAVVGVVLMAPWWLHVTRHTGSPFSNPLTDSVELDLSIDWWQYPTLRGRTPAPLMQNLAENTGPALRKVRGGMRHYAETLGEWLPWLAWVCLIMLSAARMTRSMQRGRSWFLAVGPPGLLAVTLGLMVIQYAVFSQETRHLLPLLPLFAWELCLLADRAMRRSKKLKRTWIRMAARTPPWRTALLAALFVIAVSLTPPSVGGEENNIAYALRSTVAVAGTTAAAADLAPGPVFSDTAIVPWRLDRAYVWNPLDETVEADIRRVVPAMHDAPYLRLRE